MMMIMIMIMIMNINLIEIVTTEISFMVQVTSQDKMIEQVFHFVVDLASRYKQIKRVIVTFQPMQDDQNFVETKDVIVEVIFVKQL